MSELDRDTGSHLYAARAGYRWVASHEAIAAALTANALQVVLRALGGTGEVRPFPMPWVPETASGLSEVEALDEVKRRMGGFE